MSNNIRIRAKHQPTDGKWYVDIIPPIYLNGNAVVQEGTLYFKQAFDTKEDAYALARSYLLAIGITQDVIENRVEYE